MLPADDPDVAAALDLARDFTGIQNRNWEPFITRLAGLKLPDLPFCLVPVGTFQMGSRLGRGVFKEEQPAHTQPITQPYWIAQYPVTNREWAVAVAAGVVEVPLATGDSESWYHHPGMTEAPVVGITWRMAQTFATWVGCRLPTEREWEYAARGVESWRYPWGDAWQPDIPVWQATSRGKPDTVWSHPEGQSWVGAAHLCGNIWEWTASRDGPYPYPPDGSREQITGGRNLHVRLIRRGGSWANIHPDSLRASCRGSGSPDTGNSDGGFRLACSATLPEAESGANR